MPLSSWRSRSPVHARRSCAERRRPLSAFSTNPHQPPLCPPPTNHCPPAARGAPLPPAARGFTALYADPLDRRLLGVEGSAHDGARLLYVLTLGVAPAYQRRGIAHRLLGRALQHAARAACRAVYLHVAAFNDAALAFYARAGFRQLATLPGFYTIRRVGKGRVGMQAGGGSLAVCAYGACQAAACERAL